MSVPRILVASLVSCLALTYTGGSAQTLPADAAKMASPKFLYSIDVLLDESTSPVILGIRHGQTVAQAAVGFCREQGLDGAMKSKLIPQLVKILEDGIDGALGPNTPVRDDALSPALSVEHADPDGGSESIYDLTLDDPVLTLGVSLGGEDERMLYYYAGQDVADVAMVFCTENLVLSTSAEELARCSDALSAHVTETITAADSVTTDDTPALAEGHVDPDGESESIYDSALDDPVLTLEVSLGGKDERMLYYYAGQDVADVAMAFCTENLVSSASAEELTRCSDALSAHLTENISTANTVVTDKNRSEQQQQQQDEQQVKQGETQEPKVSYSATKPLVTVPLNINGRETALQIFQGSHAMELANEFCHREELGLEESSMDSCLSQIAEIAHGAVVAYNGHDGKEQQSQVETDPFTFKIPVALAGLQLHAEYTTSETPRASALQFCTPNLRKIEHALGIEPYEGEDEEDMDASQEGGFMTEGRKSLREACTVIVEDAINAVLLGLRERVMEAEMVQANATDPSYNENSRWSQEEGVEAEAWVASQVVGDPMV